MRILTLFAFVCALSACGGGSGGDTALATPAPAPTNSSSNAQTANYKLEFKTVWDAANFPTNFPAGRHFSPPVGMTHNDQVELWQSSGIATAGFKVMAETGDTAPLATEVESFKQKSFAEHVILGTGISSSMDSSDLNFSVSQSHPMVSIVSMLAPSPDWFVGVKNLNLFENGSWKQSVTIQLVVYDAGTDNGLVFTSANSETQPQAPIVRLTTDASETDFSNGLHRDTQRAIATFTFTRTL